MQLIQATGSFWKKQSRQSLYGKKEGESVKVSLRGDGEELIAFTSRLCMEFPQINGQRSWKDLLMDMVDDFVLRRRWPACSFESDAERADRRIRSVRISALE